MSDPKPDINVDVEATLIREQHGLVEHEGPVEVKDVLTPIAKVTPDLVVSKGGYSGFFSADREPAAPPTRDQAELALLCLKVYEKTWEKYRQESRERTDQFEKQFGTRGTLSEFEHYGENTKVLDYVYITPEGPQGRYLVTFTATNFHYADDRETQSSAMMFDVTPRKLNETYPARHDNGWIAGKKDGKLELVGKYKDLHEEAEGLVDELLKRKGYTDVAEIWPMILNSHTGWLKKD